jgi:protein-tyrosine phosphatase
MRRNFDEVLQQRIFVGNAEDAQLAVSEGLVTKVYDVRVNGRQEEVPYRYVHSPIEEDNELQTIKLGAEKIASDYATGESIYIHCGSGTGRAAVMAAATLIEIGQAASIDEAMDIVKSKRPGANFKPNMIEALHELYK